MYICKFTLAELYTMVKTHFEVYTLTHTMYLYIFFDLFFENS